LKKVSSARSLNLFDAAMISSGAMIGSGIFMNSAESARFLQTSSQLLLVWILGGVIAFLGALCFAELGAMFPQSGGQVVYLERAFSPWAGTFFPLAARLHPRFGTPYVSIVLQSAWASGLLLTNTYGQLLQYVTFGDWIFFGLTALALVVLRRTMPDAPRPYKAWGYPLVPLAFLIISAAVVVNVFLSSLVKSLIGSAIILAGLPLYRLSKKKGERGI